MAKEKQTKEAADFVSVIDDIVNQKLTNRDTTAVAIVESVNTDGTLNLYVLPDTQTTIKNVINQCRYNFNSGDTALLYLINNRLSNSFVIAKYNAKSIDCLNYVVNNNDIINNNESKSSSIAIDIAKTVASGDERPVSSNGVYDYVNGKNFVTKNYVDEAISKVYLSVEIWE